MLRLLALLISCLPLSLLAQGNISRLQERLDSFFYTAIQPGAPGGSFLILQGKKTLYKRSLGYADLKLRKKFSDKTVANTGSITKTMVAYGILLLEKQGKLSIDDPILKYFPDFENPKLVEKITIRHLLTHTSGLPDNRMVSSNPVFYLTADDAQNFAPLKKTQALKFEPGTRWEYSNPAFNGLALIIEKVSSMKWQRFIQEKIFKPAGMKSSVITDGAFPDRGVAHGYELKGTEYHELDYGEEPTFCASGNGGIWCSIRDLQAYLTAMKNCAFADCDLIKKSQSVWQPQSWADSQTPFMGFSWFVTPENIGHTGSQGGFRAHLIWYPQKDLALIWLSNNSEFYSEHILKVLKQEGF
jgi:CubicO group peptidase (beta-lactamase class C family)